MIVTYVTGETGSKKIYINGELQVDEFYSYPFYPNQNTSAYLGIGDEFNGYDGRYLDGLVNNVTILNREPRQSEINFAEFDGDGLMGNWQFSSGSGNILFDHTGNQNHGTINGANWILSGCTDPYAENYNPDASIDDGSCNTYPDNGNHSLNFGGDADYVSINASQDFDLSDEQQLTISAYIKVTGNNEVIFQAEQSFGYYIGTHNNGEFSLTMYFDGYADLCLSNSQITDGNWHHVAGSYDGSEMRIYVDGVLENTCEAGVLVSQDQASPITLGSYRPGESNYQFNGSLDEFYLFNEAFTEEQIQEVMFSDSMGYYNNVVAHYKFNANEENILYDHSGNSNHGQINGAAWDEEGYQAPTTAVTFSVNMRDYVEEFGDSLDSYGGLYVAGGNIGSTNPEDSLFMGHQMYDDDGNNIYEVTLDLERNTHYEYRYRIGPASNGNWEQSFDDCGEGYYGDRYFDTDFNDSMSVGPFCWNSCENCILPNRSLSFDGVDDYVVFPDAVSLNPSAQISIGAWVKTTSLGNRQSIITKPYTEENEPYYQYHLEIRSAGELYFALSINGTRTYLQTTNPVVQPNVWYFILATYDGQQLEISINGVDSETSTAASGNLDTYSMDTWLGKLCNTCTLFEGELNEVFIFDRALSEAEGATILANGLAGSENGLVGYWNFNDGEGETLTDLSPNGNNGTIYGATWSDDVPQEPYYGPEWYVSTEGSDDNNGSYEYPFASVQHAIDAANDYDAVEIFPGEYFENIEINKSLNIGGNNDEEEITINGNQTGSTVKIEIQEMSDSIDVWLYGLRMINGRSEKGGGIFVSNARLEMEMCQVLNNQTAGQGSRGGGIYAFHSTVILHDSDVENNNTDDLLGLGAGIYAENSLVSLYDNSQINNNNSSSGSGGGLYASGPGTYLEIHNSNVNNNSSNQKGGGFYLTDSSHVYLSDSSRVSYNTTVTQGGGVYLENNSELVAYENTVISMNLTTQDCFTGQGSQGAGLYVSQSTVEYNGGYIWGNKSADAGGAIFVTNGSNVNLSYVGMDTNESAEVGGGENTIGGALGVVYDSEVNIDHCTALLNSSTSGGVGGLYAENSNVNISNSIFWDNPGEWNSESGQLIGSDYNVAYSDIQGGYPGEGNIDADPLFCNTFYYELAENSPAVGTAQDGGDMGYAGVDCESIYSGNIESVEIFVEGQSAEFNISADGDYDHFHWNVDYGETFMSNQATMIHDLSVGLHRFAAYLVNGDHGPVSNPFVQHFLVQDTVDVYFSENFDADDSTALENWGFSSNNQYGWEINNENFWNANPNGWRVPQGSGDFAFAQDHNNSDASEDYLVMPEMNLSSIGQPVALEFFSFFTGSRVYSDSLPYGKFGSSNAPYNQENYPNMSENGGDTVEDPLFIDAIPATLTGTTIGYTDDYNEVCPHDGGEAPDVVYEFTPDQDIVVDVSMCSDGNHYDTKIYVYENYVGNIASTLQGASACNDDFCYNDHTQYASFIEGAVLNAGNTYYFVIDGYGSGSYGEYELNIQMDEGSVEHTAHVEISTDGGGNW